MSKRNLQGNYEIDNLDKQIINYMVENARTPYTEIAEKVHVSAGTIHVRMKKLEKFGVIGHPHLEVDYKKLGYDITAFLGIFLTRSRMYGEVSKRLAEIPEIVALHYTTGNYSMFARIHCRDTAHLREVLHDKIQEVEGIQRTETLISLEESFTRPLQLD